jgi:hypothetical protein
VKLAAFRAEKEISGEPALDEFCESLLLGSSL